MKHVFVCWVRGLMAAAGITCATVAWGADAPARREWTVDGVKREALVYAPPATAGTDARPAPLVLAFHGHGGSMQQAARRFALQDLWPEAIIVYPQGLNTPGALTDPEGKRSGWQSASGKQDDRDLRFVDAMLATLREERAVDPKRIYAMGHSNGGGFSYLLWARRADVFTAFGPVAATPSPLDLPATPRPVLHVAGEADPLVKFAWQRRTIDFVRRLNRTGEGAPWTLDARATVYPSEVEAPVVTFIHPGGHGYPEGASELIVKFFQAHPRP